MKFRVGDHFPLPQGADQNWLRDGGPFPTSLGCWQNNTFFKKSYIFLLNLGVFYKYGVSPVVFFWKLSFFFEIS